MKRIFQIISNNKVLFKNFTSLSILQITNYLFPLITLPYLVRVLGPEKYGLVMFVMAFTAYFVSITEYGFGLSATRQISLNRNDFQKRDQIFWSVIAARLVLSIGSFIIFIFLITSIGKFSKDFGIYLFSFGLVIGSALSPLWFFQGMETMSFITIITFISRLIGTILIFLLITKQNDYPILIIIYACVSLLIGIIGVIVSLHKFKVKIIIPKASQIIFQLKDGFTLFLSTIAINLYTTSNTFILGLLTNEIAVGYFAAADKIRIAAQSILSPISQSVFPHVNVLLKESKEKFLAFNKKLLKNQTIISFGISLLLFLLSGLIVDILLGPEFAKSKSVLMILSWIPFIVSISNVYGIQTILPLGFNKQFAIIVSYSAFINILLAILFVPFLLEDGTALAFIITEIIVTSSMFLFCLKKKIIIHK